MNIREQTILIIGTIFLCLGAGWLGWGILQPDRFCAECVPVEEPGIAPLQAADRLTSGIASTMDSSSFTYFPPGSWQLSALGADPGEPANPESEPAGSVRFDYYGEELSLLTATGNFWGYMLVTVDGEPANLLPTLLNPLCQGDMANCPPTEAPRLGYKTFYEPETQTDAEWRAALPTTRWLRVHSEPNPTAAPRSVQIDIWRSWKQTPLRGVAVDALPPEPAVAWPGMLLIVVGLGFLTLYTKQAPQTQQTSRHLHLWNRLRNSPPVDGARRLLNHPLLSWVGQPTALWALAIIGVIGIAAGTVGQTWWLTLLGLSLLATSALYSLVPWVAALLFGLPFYFGVPLPLLPGRAFGLLDVGIWGGLALLMVHRLLSPAAIKSVEESAAEKKDRHARPLYILLAALIGWALVSTFAAEHFQVALREWRTLFLNAGLFAALLVGTLNGTRSRHQAKQLLVGAWLLGGTAVALVGLWQYFSGSMLITAEGVHRVRAFYGSPNNLALYLDRTLAVTLALGLLLDSLRWRWVWRLSALIQLAALILTFSKGGLFLGLPAMLITIAVLALLRGGTQSTSELTDVAPAEERLAEGRLVESRRLRPSMGPWLGQSNRRILLWIGGIAVMSMMVLVPFLGTERFQRLLDFSQGTSFVRLQLWRSAWQMALENPLLGVGPDNFLYSYRTDYILPVAWEERDLNHPHNWLLDWWTRVGLMGLFLGLSFWAAGLWRVVQKIRSEPALSIGILAAAAAALSHGLIDVGYALPDLMIVWVFVLLLQQFND